MNSIISYKILNFFVNEEIRKTWGLSQHTKSAYFLCRTFEVKMADYWETIDCTKLAPFNLDSEAKLCAEWLIQNTINQQEKKP